MGKILFAWELGAGSGHLGPFHAIGRRLIELGHDITLAVRDPIRARQMMSDITSKIVQSPIKPTALEIVHPMPSTYPMILQNVGFRKDAGRKLLNAWKSILDDHEPDLIIADHAPGAVFAGLDVIPHLCAIGNGFFVPPPVFPLPNFYGMRPDCIPTFEFISKIENEVTTTINGWRETACVPTFPTIGSVFDRLDAQFLTTFAELDHYSVQRDQAFSGALQYDPPDRNEYKWPSGVGPRVFAYLKKSRGLGHLFNQIRDLGIPTIVVMDSMDVGRLNRLATANLSFYDRPLPIERLSRECNFAVLNAGHGATCAFLRAGKPILQLPHNSEQSSTAVRTIEMNAGLVAHPDDGEQITRSFLTMLSNHDSFPGASEFAERYRTYDPRAGAALIAGQIDQLVSRSSSRRLKK